MLDLLQSVPAGVWIGLAVFGWIVGAAVTLAIATGGEFELEDDIDAFFGCSLGWPVALVYMTAAFAVRSLQHRRVCPKCKSTY